MGQNKSEELQDFRANRGAALSRQKAIFKNSIDFIKCKL